MKSPASSPASGRLFSVTLFTFLLLCSALAEATTWKTAPSFDELVRTSRLAFRGVVSTIAYHAVAVPGAERAIPYTELTFSVTRAYAGTRDGAEVTLFQAGGLDPESGMWFGVSGVPSYTEGDVVAVFANDQITPLYGALYGDRGALRILDVPGAGNRVMSHQLTPLAKKPDGAVGTLAGARCVPSPMVASSCNALVDSETQQRITDPTRLREMRNAMVSVEELDAHIAAVRRSATELAPAQTISGDQESFRSLYENFIARLNRADAAR
ncbi:MAG: hypothetical protein HYV63_27920 [Candidatus Schekmanbacteria bacterium]|nr:hypothetical protein [Candidatus Schekmanbacteria bacterium]